MTTPLITNVLLHTFERGDYHDQFKSNTVLVQNLDPDMEFPAGVDEFASVHQFEFLDLEQDSEFGEEFMITQDQADQIASVLVTAFENKNNVLVHCVAGVCRGGAVVEVGTMLGFRDLGAWLCPNTLVKQRLMRSLNFLPIGAD